jgi:hypothetical protein
MNLSGRNYQTGGGVYPLIPFDPYQNEKILKGGEEKMSIVTRLGEPLFGMTNYAGNFSYPDSPFSPDLGNPDFSAETPENRFLDEARPVPTTLGASPESITEKMSLLFSRYKWPIIILSGFAAIYLWKNREAIKERLGLE